jgi:hypothetical protein
MDRPPCHQRRRTLSVPQKRGLEPMSDRLLNSWTRAPLFVDRRNAELHLGDAARSVQNCTLSGIELEKVVAGAPIGTQQRDEA